MCLLTIISPTFTNSTSPSRPAASVSHCNTQPDLAVRGSRGLGAFGQEKKKRPRALFQVSRRNALFCVSFDHCDELYVEHQCAIRPNHLTRPAFAVAQLRRNDELKFAAGLH